jgi:excisionase family DNA binding protein
MDDYLTPDEVAAELRVTSAAVRGWCRDGILPADKVVKQWRIKRADLVAFLASRRAGGERDSVVPATESLYAA